MKNELLQRFISMNAIGLQSLQRIRANVVDNVQFLVTIKHVAISNDNQQAADRVREAIGVTIADLEVTNRAIKRMSSVQKQVRDVLRGRTVMTHQLAQRMERMTSYMCEAAEDDLQYVKAEAPQFVRKERDRYQRTIEIQRAIRKTRASFKKPENRKTK